MNEREGERERKRKREWTLPENNYYKENSLLSPFFS